MVSHEGLLQGKGREGISSPSILLRKESFVENTYSSKLPLGLGALDHDAGAGGTIEAGNGRGDWTMTMPQALRRAEKRIQSDHTTNPDRSPGVIDRDVRKISSALHRGDGERKES